MTAPEDPAAVPAAVEQPPTDGAATRGAAADLPADEPAAGKPPKKQRSFWRELPFLVIIALVLALLIKTFLVQAFYIPSASMEPTLMGGPPQGTGVPISAGNPSEPYDRVLVNKLVYDFRDPHRGEIVVFKKPPGWTDVGAPEPTTGIVHWIQDVESAIGIPVNNTEDIIKRVIGVPGDVVRCQRATGALAGKGYGGSVLSVNGKSLTEPYLYPQSSECGSSDWTKKVPAGDLWVMGDHRNDSSDSRVNGFVPINDVVGRAFVVIWPHQDWKTLSVPSTFNQTGLTNAEGIATSPPLLGLVGALPLTLWRRRRLVRRDGRRRRWLRRR